MDVLVLIDKLDDTIHNAKPVPLTDQVRVDKEEVYDILDQMRATIPEEIKQARWIVKEREEQVRLISEEEIVKQAERQADEIIEDARAREREIRLGAEDYADDILNTLEVNLTKFIAAVQRGRDRLRGGSLRSGPAQGRRPLSLRRVPALGRPRLGGHGRASRRRADRRGRRAALDRQPGERDARAPRLLRQVRLEPVLGRARQGHHQHRRGRPRRTHRAADGEGDLHRVRRRLLRLDSGPCPPTSTPATASATSTARSPSTRSSASGRRGARRSATRRSTSSCSCRARIRCSS